MKSVDNIIDELIGREGGYSNNPADRGGPTRWGVTEQTARAYGYTGDMKALPRDLAVSIYRKRYWQEPRFAEVGAIYAALAVELFDTGVNMGQGVAARFLQRALNLLNRKGSDYPDIAADGRIGNMTLAALKAFKAKRGAAGEDVLIKLCDGLQLARYVEIAERNPSQETFVYGWVANRIGELA